MQKITANALTVIFLDCLNFLTFTSSDLCDHKMRGYGACITLRALRPFGTGRTDYARIRIFIIIAATLLIKAGISAIVLAVIAVAIARASHKRILSAHKKLLFQFW